MLQDIDLKYVSGALTTTRNLTLSGSGANLTVGGTLTVASVPMLNAQPGDVGLKGWSYDPVAASQAQAVSSGVVYLSGIYVRAPITVSNLWYVQSTAGTSPTAGQNWIGLYSSNGTLMASAGLDSVLTSTGLKQVSITSQNLTAGLYWVGLLMNATSQQALTTSAVGAVQGVAALGATTGATSRYAINGTGATTLANITPSSNSSTNAKYFWVGVS